MRKKSLNILTYLPLVTLAVAMIGGFVKFQVQAETTKSKVEKLEVDSKTELDKVKTDIKEITIEGNKEIEEVKKDNQEIEKGLTEMRVEQKYLQQSVIDLNNNIKELVQEIKQKKK